MDNSRPTWAEIDLGAIRSNIWGVKKIIPHDTLLMAVVKANAYGHGMVEVARACLQAGAGYLGVATLEEALTLRENQIDAPILVLGYIDDDASEMVVENHIDATVYSTRFAQALSQAAVKLAMPAQVHIKIDTGMGRIGFLPESATCGIVRDIASLPGIFVKGIFSHFATADARDKSFAGEQLARFDQMIAELGRYGVNIPLKHIANSAAIMDMPGSHYNMVRAGIVTYGLYPSSEVMRDNLSVVPAMRLKSRVAFLKDIPAGSTVSYGRTYRSTGLMKVATIPIGYADGYSRLLSNRAWGVIKNQPVPQIGTICMDQCMFDVSKVKDIKEGDEIILFGRPQDGITADQLAEIMGTINYEIVCAVNSRVPRVYVE